MKLHKVELYIVDFEGYGLEKFLLNCNQADGFIAHDFKCETVEIPYVDWSDENPLNQRSITQGKANEMFNLYQQNQSTINLIVNDNLIECVGRREST